MEIGGRELLQFVTLVASLAGAFAVVKSQLGRAIGDLKTITDNLDKLKVQINENRREDMSEVYSKLNQLDGRVDTVQSTEAVITSQLDTLRQINSVDRLENANRLTATILADIKSLRRDVDAHRAEYLSAHNGSHKYIPPPKVD
jgi:archaellum component FlaC